MKDREVVYIEITFLIEETALGKSFKLILLFLSNISGKYFHNV
jgi:hypothetical protein